MVRNWAVAGLMLLATGAAHAQSQIPPGKLIKLGSEIEFPPEYFASVDGKLRLPCSSPPFTAEEIRRVARQKLTTVKTPFTPSPIEAVRLQDGRVVPLTSYVTALNKAEAFYNSQGVTLRSGPFKLAAPASRGSAPPIRIGAGGKAGPIGARPGPIGTGGKIGVPDPVKLTLRCVGRGDPGAAPAGEPLIHLTLREPPPPKSPEDNGPRVPRPPERKATKPPELFHDPGIMRDLVFDPARALRGEVLDKATMTRMPDLVGKSKAPGNGVPGGFAPPEQQFMSGCPAKKCELAADTPKTAAALDLLANWNKVVKTVWFCTIAGGSGPQKSEDPKKCELGLTSGKQDFTLLDLWSPALKPQFFLANANNPCAVLGAFGGDYKSLATYYNFAPPGSGNEKLETGEKAGNFFDGAFTYTNDEIADCLFDASSNGFFVVRFCLGYATADSYSKPKGFRVVNTAGVVAKVGLFGVDFDLIDGTATNDWKQGTPPTAGIVLTQPQTSATLKPFNDEQKFEGPTGVFLIGPVPLSVRTFATLTVNAATPKPSFDSIALVPGLDDPGSVGMSVGAGAKATLGFDAAIDTLILRAGVSGRLDLIDGNIAGGIATTIDPFRNFYRIDKTYEVNATALKGTVSAFVEVDLLVYSERYEVDIVSFGGKNLPVAKFGKSWGPYHSKIPATIKGPKCS